MNTKVLTIIAIGAVLCATLAFTDTDGADSGFDVTDGTQKTFHFDGAAEHIVLNGTGAALTVADAGAIDKIVAVDKFATYEYSKLEQLKDLNAVDLGSFYSESNYQYVCAELIRLVGEGKMTTEDPIILTAFSNVEKLRGMLNDSGFSTVLVWTTESIDEYNDIISFVEGVSMIVTGTEAESVKEMKASVERVTSVVSGVPEEERTKAISIWIQSGTGILVNNKGIANSMLDLCNAYNIGYDESKGAWYGDVNTVISLLEANPGTVIFLPDKWASSGNTVEDFRNDVLGGRTDYTIIQMDAIWNNFCPESADGLVSMAEALYPELFGVEPSEEPGSGNGDNSSLIMWGVALVAAIIIVAAAYVAFKRIHG